MLQTVKCEVHTLQPCWRIRPMGYHFNKHQCIWAKLFSTCLQSHWQHNDIASKFLTNQEVDHPEHTCVAPNEMYKSSPGITLSSQKISTEKYHLYMQPVAEKLPWSYWAVIINAASSWETTMELLGGHYLYMQPVAEKLPWSYWAVIICTCSQ